MAVVRHAEVIDKLFLAEVAKRVFELELLKLQVMLGAQAILYEGILEVEIPLVIQVLEQLCGSPLDRLCIH